MKPRPWRDALARWLPRWVAEAVSVPLTGLTAGTTYHFRLVADNGTGGVQHGADGVFHTAPATPVTATNVTVYGASLHGVVNPHGAATTYHFEYGTSTAYGQSTPETDAGSSGGEKSVTQAIGENHAGGQGQRGEGQELFGFHDGLLWGRR